MENPWKNLKKINNEYISEYDKYYIDNYYKYSLKGDYSLKLNITPGPYTGDLINSKVYLLALNPGYDDNDIIFTEKYGNIAINNLNHIFDEYPFIFFNSIYRGTPGEKWWKDKLSHFINDIGLENVAKKVCNIEYFPYSSKKYKHTNVKLPSQEYSFSFVKKAIKDNKIIIIMRSERIWYNTIPELINYRNKYVLHSPRKVNISPNNLGENEYKIIINELNK